MRGLYYGILVIVQVLISIGAVGLINADNPVVKASQAKDILMMIMSVGGNFYAVLLTIVVFILTKNRMKYLALNLIIVAVGLSVCMFSTLGVMLYLIIWDIAQTHVSLFGFSETSFIFTLLATATLVVEVTVREIAFPLSRNIKSRTV